MIVFQGEIYIEKSRISLQIRFHFKDPNPLEQQVFSSKGWNRILLLAIPYFLIAGLFQYVGYRLAGVDFVPDAVMQNPEQPVIIKFFDLAGTVLIIWLFTKYIDEKEFVNVGFRKYYIWMDLLTGVLIGFIVMIFGLISLAWAGKVQIKMYDFDIKNLLLTTIHFVLVGILEELLFRGYVLNNLMISFNKYLALIISTVLFTVMHFANPNLDLLGITGLFLAGILLGMCYLVTNNLWLPIALHFSWNFFQSLFGFNVSGQDYYSMVVTSFQKADEWNGGAFGFEGSILSIPFQIFAIIFIFSKFKSRLPITNTILHKQ